MNDIYVNARFLTQPVTGVQRFASEISKQLKNLLPDIKFVCPHNIIQTDLAKALNVEKIGKLTGHLWEQTELPLFLKRRGSPLFISLGNTGPVFYKNTIVTIHDLSIFMFRHAYSKKFYLTYKYLLPAIIKNSKKVITVSEGAKGKIMEILDVPASKIEVIYNAASHLQFQPLVTKPVYVPEEKYILAVASFNPIKNLPALIKAFNQINDKEIKLVVAGAKQKAFADEYFDEHVINSERIIFTGHINDQNELLALYKNATAFVFPSLYESFGIPTLEAMACGCPVIVSHAGSLPEVCGDAALYVNPAEIHTITEKINILLNDSNLRRELIEKGYKRVQVFNWADSARKLVNIIESVK